MVASEAAIMISFDSRRSTHVLLIVVKIMVILFLKELRNDMDRGSYC